MLDESCLVVSIAGTGVWSANSNALSVGRYGLAAASLGTKIIFAGGYTGSSFSRVADVYDTGL